jgi:hypothetical protein
MFLGQVTDVCFVSFAWKADLAEKQGGITMARDQGTESHWRRLDDQLTESSSGNETLL